MRRALVLALACSSAPAPTATAALDWDLAWLPASVKMIATAPRGVTLDMTAKLPDSALGQLYAGLGDCSATCTATVYPIADRLIGVPSVGLSVETTKQVVRFKITYANAADAAHARDRLRERQLDPMVPPRIADALAASRTELAGAAVVVAVDLGAPPWSAFSQDDLAAFTAGVQAHLASDPAFPGLQPRSPQ